MSALQMEVLSLLISPGHDFYGRHEKGRLDHGIEDRDTVSLVAGKGIEGDRFFNYKENYKGQVTFFEAEVWERVMAEFELPDLEVGAFRRNVVTRGLDLTSLIGKRFSLGSLEFEGTEEAKPCYWMDEACAPGVEEFLRGQGGLRARILSGGELAKGTYEFATLGE